MNKELVLCVDNSEMIWNRGNDRKHETEREGVASRKSLGLIASSRATSYESSSLIVVVAGHLKEHYRALRTVIPPIKQSVTGSDDSTVIKRNSSS